MTTRSRIIMVLATLLAMSMVVIVSWLQFAPSDDISQSRVVNITLTPEILPAAALTSQEDTVRFAVIGDYGDNSNRSAEVAALVNSWNPDLIITTGDNNYPDGEVATIDDNVGQYYHQYIYPYTGNYGEGAAVNRFFPTLGNHDWSTEDAQPFIDYFSLPGKERYYDFVWGPVHFFAVDSDHHEPDGVEEGSIQYEWLRTGLTSSTAPWQIVYFHHPPYTSGDRREPDEDIRWDFKEWGADAVLNGHNHLYERLVVDGIPFFVNGLGGNDVYSFGPPAEGSEFRYNSSHGAMLVEATPTQIIFQFYSSSGKPIDYISDDITVGEWIELDVTGAIQGNGTISFILDSTYDSSVLYSSREDDEYAPQLVIQVQGQDTPLVFEPVADAYVRSDNPDSNYNSDPYLRLRRKDDEHYRGYLSFAVAGVSGEITDAKLRLFPVNGDPEEGGVALYSTANFFQDTNEPWTEDELQWDNAPLIQSQYEPIDTFVITK